MIIPASSSQSLEDFVANSANVYAQIEITEKNTNTPKTVTNICRASDDNVPQLAFRKSGSGALQGCDSTDDDVRPET